MLTCLLIAGLVMSIMGKTSGGAVRIYQITYIVGFFLGSILHMAVNKLFPPPGYGIAEEFNHGAIDGTIIEGVDPSVNSDNTPAKSPVTLERKVSGSQEM